MELFDFFKQREVVCREEQKRLQAEDCADEAVFEKIKENIYGIFHSLISVSINQYPNDSSKACDDFISRLNQISSHWALAYQKAEQHNDAKKMHIESIKLNVAQEIRETIPQLWREEI